MSVYITAYVFVYISTAKISFDSMDGWQMCMKLRDKSEILHKCYLLCYEMLIWNILNNGLNSLFYNIPGSDLLKITKHNNTHLDSYKEKLEILIFISNFFFPIGLQTFFPNHSRCKVKYLCPLIPYGISPKSNSVR